MDDRTAPVERVGAVLATFDADAVHRTAATLSSGDLAALAGVLGVPRRLLEDGAAAARILQRRTRSVAPEARPEIALMLAAACNEDTVAALGPRHEDPTREDMIEVLDAIVDRHGCRVVALMLAAYVDSAAPCATVFADLLDTDERFAMEALAEQTAHDVDEGDEVPAASVDGSPVESAPSASNKASGAPDPEREARRRERKERERAEKDRRARQAEATEAARRRRKEARRRPRDG